MNFVRSGLQDVRRRIHAQQSKLSLVVKRRELRHAEIALGKDGWEDFRTEPAITEAVEKIRELNISRETASTQRATLEQRRALISSKLDEEKATAQKALSELGTLRAPKMEELKNLNGQLSGSDKTRAQLAKEIKTLEAEEARLRQSLTTLVETLPGEKETREVQIGDRLTSLNSERESLKSKIAASELEVRPLMDRRDREKAAVEHLNDQIRAERNRYDAEERIAKAQMRDLDTELSGLKRSIAEIENSQAEPFGVCGRWIASQESRPERLAEKIEEVRSRQAAIAELEGKILEIRTARSEADPQDLRKFYFVAVSVLALVALSVALFFGSPATREWLPAGTDVIVSVNAAQFSSSEFAKKWQREDPKGWGLTWGSMLEPARTLPELELQGDVTRITRAIAKSDSETSMFTLVETQGPVLTNLQKLSESPGFVKTQIRGIEMISNGSRSEAAAPVGPSTLAVGTPAEVEALVLVRLGIKPDLKINEHFFGKFRRLQQGSAFSLISRDPMGLKTVFSPLFSTRLLESSRLVGLALRVDTQVQARLLIRTEDYPSATEIVGLLEKSPGEILRLGDDDFPLFEGKPQISYSGHEIEARFTMTQQAALRFFERLTRLHLPEQEEVGRVGRSQ